MSVHIQRQHRTAGDVHLKVIRPHFEVPSPGRRMSLAFIQKMGFPRPGLSPEVLAYRRANASRLVMPALKIVAGNALGLAMMTPALYLTKIARCRDCAEKTLELCARMKEGPTPDFAVDFPLCPRCNVIPLGLASLNLVTTAGVNYIVDAFIDSPSGNNVELFDFHGIGTTNTAEAIGDTALVAELTTQYNPDNTRATGTPSEGASANIYRSVGTNTVDGASAIVEHGLFTQAATGGGTLLDRSVFSVINLGASDSLQSTYEATFAAGG